MLITSGPSGGSSKIPRDQPGSSYPSFSLKVIYGSLTYKTAHNEKSYIIIIKFEFKYNCFFKCLIVYYGPLHFYESKYKERTNNNLQCFIHMDSCPFIVVIVFPNCLINLIVQNKNECYKSEGLFLVNNATIF